MTPPRVMGPPPKFRAVAAQRAQCNPVAWDEFVESQPDGWWFHTSHWLDYALAYTPNATDNSHAIVLLPDNKIVAVIPGVLAPDGTPVCGGQPTPAPVVDPYIQADVKLTIGGDKRMTVGWRPGQPCLLPLAPQFVLRGRETYVVDLAQDEATLWRHLRKSYKSLIHKAAAEHLIDVSSVARPDDQATWRIDRAHGLHVQAAGRETRSPETWRLMKDWLRDGHAVLALAQTQPSTGAMAPIGYTYTIRWKHWAYYASSATLAPNLAHALIWETIRVLRADGVTRWFEIGDAERPGDDVKATQIAFFKSGFGGKLWTAHEAFAK